MSTLFPLEVMVKSQPELLLRVMSESVAMKPQGLVLKSVAHITTREHGDIPSWDNHQGSYGCPWDCAELALPLIGSAIQCPASCLSSKRELSLVVLGAQVRWFRG